MLVNWLAFGVAVLTAAPRASAAPTPEAEAYDYIIVGGGTAGVAVAARLSQGLPRASILLVEAGPAVWDEPKINIPGNKGTALGGPYDWNFTTTAQPGVAGRKIPVNRGKLLGGTSALNFMSYDRAAAVEYDSWGELGSAGWDWERMIAAMKKSETFTGANSDTYGSEGVGDSGPIQAVINRIIPEQQQKTWFPTLKKLGFEQNLESLGGKPNGASYQPNSIDATTYNRSWAANAYVPLAGANVEFMTETTVAKINLAEAADKHVATGITLEGGQVIKATREVILAAGSVQSPGLLEVSGIGSSKVLSAAGVDQIIDLPGVGENLQDHLRIQSSYQLKPEYRSFDILKSDAALAAEELALWHDNKVSLYDYAGSGFVFGNWDQVLGRNASSRMTALAEAAVAKDGSKVDQKKLAFLADATVPQLEVIFSDGYTGVKGYPAKDDALFGKGFFSLLAVVMHPLSRGSIHIDAAGRPVINPNYLSNEHDLEAVTQAIKFCRKIASTEPMRSVWESEYEPGLDNVKTDDEWRAFVQKTAMSIYHPVGTCSMLPKADGGVVDAQLRVYGTTNLRVVDASIIPLLISAHIQTAVYGIAEVAAEMIVKDNQ